MNAATKTSQNGVSFIKRHEGWSPVPYWCQGGYPTIGYGHLLQDDQVEFFEQHPLSEKDGLNLLLDDIEIAENAVLRLITRPLTQGQFDALVSFTFNLGAGALQRSTLRRCVNRGDMSQAVSEFKRWCRAGGKKLDGLLRRRRHEAMIFQAT